MLICHHRRGADQDGKQVLFHRVTLLIISNPRLTPAS
jgi:hypothetical protein